MDQLIPLLAGFGPWGILAGAGLTLLVQWVKRRQNPTPTPAPGPAPVNPTDTPVLDALLAILRKRLVPPAAPKADAIAPADIDHETVAKVLGALPPGK